MTENDDLPPEVRRQDEEDELQVAGQLAELRKDTEATQDEEFPERCDGKTKRTNCRSPGS